MRRCDAVSFTETRFSHLLLLSVFFTVSPSVRLWSRGVAAINLCIFGIAGPCEGVKGLSGRTHESREQR